MSHIFFVTTDAYNTIHMSDCIYIDARDGMIFKNFLRMEILEDVLSLVLDIIRAAARKYLIGLIRNWLFGNVRVQFISKIVLSKYIPVTIYYTCISIPFY